MKAKISKYLQEQGFQRVAHPLYIQFIKDKECIVMPKGKLAMHHLVGIRTHLHKSGYMNSLDFDAEFIHAKPKTKYPDMQIKAGRVYKIKIPNYGRDKVKVHIDYILDNPTLSKHTDDPTYVGHLLVVYRAWIKHKRYWKHWVEPYYVLCMWNDWTYVKP